MRRERGRCRGQILPLAAIFGVVLCGFAAIAIDLGAASAERRDLQTASDAAGLAGNRSAAKGPTAVKYVAMQYLAKDLGFAPPATCASVSSCAPTTFSVGSGYTVDLRPAGSMLDISVQHTRRTSLAGVIGFTSTVSGAATRVRLTPTCVLCVLDPTAYDSLFVEGSGNLTVLDPTGTGDGIVVNSDASGGGNSALHLASGQSGTVTAPSITVVGGADPVSSGRYSTPPVTGIPHVLDPLADLPAVDASTCLDRPACTAQVTRGSVTCSSGTRTLDPGIYDAITPTGTCNLALKPGIYVIKGGLSSNTDAGVNITGAGVMIYLACSGWPSQCATNQTGAGLNFQGNGGIATKAPTSGPYQGMAIFADRNNASAMQLQSSGGVVVSGTIYGASALLTYSSNGPTVPLNSAFAVGRITVQSSQNLTISYDPSANSPRFTTLRNQGIIR